MATSKQPRPSRPLPPETPVVSYPTPNFGDLTVVQDVDTRLPGYVAQEYGDLHPDQVNFPNLKLVFQQPLDNEQNYMWVRRVYAADRINEDDYNYALKFSSSNPSYPIYIRSYTILRSSYTPFSIGSVDPGNPNAFLVDEQVTRLKDDQDDGQLDSLYVRVVRTYETIPGPGLTKVAYGSAKIIPEKFQAAQTVTSTKTVVQPSTLPDTINGTTIESVVEQVTSTRAEKVTSNITDTPVPLTSTKITPQQQTATVTETLVDTGTSAASLPTLSATIVEASSENLGNGKNVLSVTSVSSVFPETLYSAERPLWGMPMKFKYALPPTTTSSVSAGQPAPSDVSLGLGDTEASSEQVSSFKVKKKRVNIAVPSTTPISIKSYKLAPQGQLATITESILGPDSNGNPNQTVTSSLLTLEANVDNLGDGTTVTNVTTVASHPQLVGKSTYEGQVATVTKQVIDAALYTAPALSLTQPEVTIDATEIHKAVQTVVTRDAPPQLSGAVLTNSPVGAVYATITDQTVAAGATGAVAGSFTTLSANSQPVSPIANKQKVVTLAGGSIGGASQGTSGSPAYPTLTSYDYDSQANIEVTTTRQVVAAGTAAPSLVPPALITGATASSQFGSPAVTMDDYKTQNYQSLILTQKDNPIDQWKTLRITSKIPYLPATRTEYKTGSFTIPSLLRGVNMSLWQMPSGRYDVKWTPNQRAAVGVPTPFRVVTSFHYGYPTDLVTSSNNALFQFKPSNLIYRGDSFTVNIPNVINDGFIMGACFDQTTFTPSTTGYTTAIVVGGVTSSTDTFFTFGSLGLIGDNGSGQGDPAGYIRYQLAALNNDSILGAVNEQVIFAPSSPSLSQYLSYTSPSSTFVNSTAAITAHQKISSKTSTYYTCTITIPSTSTIPAGSYVVVTGNSLANTTSPVFLSNGLAGSGTFSYTVGPTATTSITTGLTVTVYSGDPQSATKLTSYDVEYWRAGIYIMRRHYVTLF